KTTMFLVNLLTRNDTDRFVPMFEIIYSLELIFIVLALVLATFVVLYIAREPKLPLTIRLRIISAILVDFVHLCSRIGVIHHQYYGPSEYVESSDLIFGSVMREIFLGYITALVAILALDRWVATKAWAWYESGARSTLIFFALQESILFSICAAVAVLVVNEYITDMESIYYFAVIVVFGASCFMIVYRHNLRVMRKMKRGAVVNQYSVARTYQIRENITLLRVFSQIARPLVIVCIPPFAFYPIFTHVPPNIGWDGLRFFSASMYDLWLSLASLVVISCLPYYW
ncbi:hypothetical protein PMAYCL1PPCAC_27847, partial [Pristionchus mayeri]